MTKTEKALELSQNKSGAVQVGKFIIRRTGLEPIGNPTYDEWLDCSNTLYLLEGSIQWALGDWLNYGESKWGEKYAQAVEDTGYYNQTLRDDKWVSSRIDLSLRKDNLTFSHHKEVASLEPDEQEELLDRAESDNLTVRQLRDAVRQKKAHNELAKLPKRTSPTGVRIIRGDMLRVVPTLNNIDLVVADPPYNVTDWNWDKLGTPAEFIDQTREWLSTIKIALRDKYHLFWFCSPQFAADIEMVFRELNLPIKSRVVWHRRNMAMGSVAKDKFIDSWEMILHAGTKPLNFSDEWGQERFDVQTYAVPQTNFSDTKYHPTQKPIELIQWLVNHGSIEGESVLDPFAGSGTTGAACIGTRECILIERELEYIGIMEARLGTKPEGR